MKPENLPALALDKLFAFEAELQSLEDLARSAALRLDGMPRADPRMVAKLQQQRAKTNRKRDDLHALTNSIRQWITSLPNHAQFELAPVPANAQRDDETIAQSVERLRDEIQAARASMIG